MDAETATVCITAVSGALVNYKASVTHTYTTYTIYQPCIPAKVATPDFFNWLILGDTFNAS